MCLWLIGHVSCFCLWSCRYGLLVKAGILTVCQWAEIITHIVSTFLCLWCALGGPLRNGIHAVKPPEHSTKRHTSRAGLQMGYICPSWWEMLQHCTITPTQNSAVLLPKDYTIAMLFRWIMLVILTFSIHKKWILSWQMLHFCTWLQTWKLFSCLSHGLPSDAAV